MQPMKIDHSRSFYDAVKCRTFTELIITDPAAPYVIGMRVVLNDTNGKIKKIWYIHTVLHCKNPKCGLDSMTF